MRLEKNLLGLISGKSQFTVENINFIFVDGSTETPTIDIKGQNAVAIFEIDKEKYDFEIEFYSFCQKSVYHQLDSFFCDEFGREC
ncbi:MAG: hypothetical protein N2645_05460 [Clostridia bacterium]|nr:hypothetical protein [Clostridia bacterium]